MANYEDLKKKAKDAIETIADVSVEAYKIAEEKAKVLAKRTKLNAEITREKALIRRLKSDIGSKYYDMHKDDPEEALQKECENITASITRINANKSEIEELKKSGATCSCEDCDTESDSDEKEECCAEDTECCAEAESAPASEEENKTEY